LATAIAWVMIQGGQWTRIFQGPSIHILGGEVLELQAFTSSQSSYMVSFTIHRYSALAPFFYSISNSRTAEPQSVYPVGSSSIFYLPAITSSPFTEFWLLTDRSCRAHILV
jgi:hypothetical protein